MKHLTAISLFTAAFLFGTPASAADAAVASPGGHHMLLVFLAVVQLIAILALSGILSRFGKLGTRFSSGLKQGGHVETSPSREGDPNRPKGGKTAVALALFVTLGGNAFGEVPSGAPEFPALAGDPLTVLLICLNALLLVVILYLSSTLKKLIRRMMPDFEPELTTHTPQGSVQVAMDEKTKPGKASTFIKSLTDAVPIEREEDIMLGHEYDGIRELDNRLPPWWVWMFWATIVFSVVYLAWYHILPYGKTQLEEYETEMAQAEIDREAYLATQEKPVDENTVVYLTDVENLAAGEKIYVANCLACHAPDGGGGVGPNFTDDYWIHGGSINDIFYVVKYGVPQMGMISWESLLRPEEIAQVSSYVKSFQGTTPANPKEPQGELWTPREPDAETDTETEADTDGESPDASLVSETSEIVGDGQ